MGEKDGFDRRWTQDLMTQSLNPSKSTTDEILGRTFLNVKQVIKSYSTWSTSVKIKNKIKWNQLE